MDYAVIKLGGSVISPRKELLNTEIVRGYLEEIRKFYAGDRAGKPRLVLVVGGGNISRVYRDFADSCGEDNDVDRHRIGITTTWVNAELMRSLLGEIAFERVLGVGVYAENQKEAEKSMAKDFEAWLGSDIPVLVSGGFINGASTDLNAVLIASKIGTDRIFKLTDVDHVYSSDPRVDEEAKPLDSLSWTELFRLFDATLENPQHTPGGHIPVDLLAARLALENKIGCFLTDGREAGKISDILEEKEIPGTFIHP